MKLKTSNGEKSAKSEVGSLKEIDKILIPSAILIKKKKKTQIVNIRN